MSDVVVLGAGLMGSAVARRLAASGLDVGVWNRSVERAAPLADDGVTVHESLREALASAPVAISVLASADALRAVLGDLGGELRGRTLVNLSSGTPDDARELQQLAGQAGAAYLDGMISGRPRDAGTELMHVTVAGSEDAWGAQRGLLERLTPHVEHTGEDVAVPTVLGLTCTAGFFLTALGAFVEAAAFAARHGIGPDQVAAQVPRYLGRVATEVESFTQLMVSGDFTTENASADVYAEALDLLAAAMADQGQPGHIARAAVTNLRLVQDAGRGGESPAAVFDELA